MFLKFTVEDLGIFSARNQQNQEKLEQDFEPGAEGNTTIFWALSAL